jgi:hypothetical protein
MCPKVFSERNPMITKVVAVEYVRRMRGGSQAHLLRCSDGEYYVVKFQNNPQGTRILANELLAAVLAGRLGLPVPESAIVDVAELLLKRADDLTIQSGRGNVSCSPGTCFGSRLPSEAGPYGIRVPIEIHSFLPDCPPQKVRNNAEFVRMLVFDKWTCNSDFRQVMFTRASGSRDYTVTMIDNGCCFNGLEWSFPNLPRGGLSPRASAYETVLGIDSFETWIQILEDDAGGQLLDHLADEIPPEWYQRDRKALHGLLGDLNRRRHHVRALLYTTRWKFPQCFPNWASKHTLIYSPLAQSRPLRAKAKEA